MPGPSSSRIGSPLDRAAGAGHRRERREPGGGSLRGGHDAAGSPRGQADAPARAAYPQQLGGGAGLVRGEHDAEGGQHDVERAVGERQRLRVSVSRFQVQALDLGAAGGRLEQPRHEVGGGHPGAAPGGRQGGVARAGGDIQHAFAGMDVDRPAQHLPDEDLLGPGPGEVAQRPHSPRPLCHQLVRIRWSGDRHGVPPN